MNIVINAVVVYGLLLKVKMPSRPNLKDIGAIVLFTKNGCKNVESYPQPAKTCG